MAKQKKPKLTPLEETLKFMSLVGNAASEQSLFCLLNDHKAIAFNQVVEVGAPIDNDISACPETSLFLAALAESHGSFSLTELSPTKLLLRSGDFYAYIPCADPSAFVWRDPDAIAGPLDDRFLDALKMVAPIVNPLAEAVHLAAIHLRNETVLAIGDGVLIEAWHGWSFPEHIDLLIPRIAFNTIKRAKKTICGFGFSPETFTVHFADGCWMLTKLFPVKLNVSVKANLVLTHYPCKPIPLGFFNAIERVAPFSTDGKIYVNGNRVSSHPFHITDKGSSLTQNVEGMEHEYSAYMLQSLEQIASFATEWSDAKAAKGATYFAGNNARGVLYRETPHYPTKELNDDDIPF